MGLESSNANYAEALYVVPHRHGAITHISKPHDVSAVTCSKEAINKVYAEKRRHICLNHSKEVSVPHCINPFRELSPSIHYFIMLLGTLESGIL